MSQTSLIELLGAAPRRVVAFFAHPDDEAFAAAGLLVRCRRAGAQISIISATRGEAGRPRQRERFAAVDRVEVAALRSRELAGSCAALGADAPRFLELEDGAIEATSETAIEALAAQLDQLAPDLVVTFGDDGAYAHRDHRACPQLLSAALGMSTGSWPKGLPRVLQAQFPRGLFTPLRRALRRMPFIDRRVAADALGIDLAQATLRLVLDEDEHAIKRAALAAHASQLIDGDAETFLHPEIIRPLLQEEWYTLASAATLESPLEEDLP